MEDPHAAEDEVQSSERQQQRPTGHRHQHDAHPGGQPNRRQHRPDPQPVRQGRETTDHVVMPSIRDVYRRNQNNLLL